MSIESIGARIRRVRIMRGISIIDLAKIVRVSAPCIGHLELGQHATNMFTFIDIASALGVSTDYLAFGGKYGNEANQFSEEPAATHATRSKGSFGCWRKRSHKQRR